MNNTDRNTFTELLEQEDPRTIAEMKAEDEYQEGIITDAELSGGTWSITWKGEDGGSMGCGCPAKDDVEIKPGDRIRIYSRGFGFFEFHGIDINDVEMFWRTPWERFAHRVKWLADYDREKRERFVTEEDKLDTQYDQLSVPMKARIDRFRAKSPSFRVESEAYEAFACVQGDVFCARAREALETGEVNEPEVLLWFTDGTFEKELPGWAESKETLAPEARWLLWWAKQPYERQHELMPEMSGDHSGNTFGCALQFGVALIKGDLV